MATVFGSASVIAICSVAALVSQAWFGARARTAHSQPNRGCKACQDARVVDRIAPEHHPSWPHRDQRCGWQRGGLVRCGRRAGRRQRQERIQRGALWKRSLESPRGLCGSSLNTHGHPDHTGGNESFVRKGAIVIGHESLRERAGQDPASPAANGAGTAAVLASRPTITTTDALALHINGERLDVVHVADAHTGADLVARWNDADVVALGDIYWSGQYPFIDVDSGARLPAWWRRSKPRSRAPTHVPWWCRGTGRSRTERNSRPTATCWSPSAARCARQWSRAQASKTCGLPADRGIRRPLRTRRRPGRGRGFRAQRLPRPGAEATRSLSSTHVEVDALGQGSSCPS